MNVTFKSSNKEVVVPLVHTVNSNFFTAVVSLQPDQYSVSASMTYDVGKDVLIRMWIPSTDRKLKVKYADLDMNQLTTGPDTGAKISMDIRDCNGNEIKLYDVSQQQQMTDVGDAYFVPFFCVENSSTTVQCAAGTESKYNV
ncbi:hypothetical protein COOONC_06507, partial [Cooperia oncophora]